ncbi:MAG: TonB-dependent receptor plug domain-containing protein [Steroidobacter sp.]
MATLDKPRCFPTQTCASIYLGALLLLSSSVADGAQTVLPVTELKKLSLEELSDIEVTSVSRREETANEASAAVHVITEEDIRRSGARSIPEALRLAPNLQVAQSGSRSWAISARGFNAPFANKLLVLIDGRTVYSPLFSGVFWDAQDTLLEDIERIEVISGPGATVWGANAVNGVINIITKHARDTQGVLVAAGAGTEERLLGGFRYGAEAGEDLHYRFYAKYFDRDDSVLADGESAADSWYSGQAGFRMDWTRSQDLLTLQADVYGGHGEQPGDSDISQSGGNLLARWTRNFTDAERLQIQAYYDRTHQFAAGDFGDDLDTFDLDTQYGRDLGDRQHLLIGAGYRFTHDSVENVPEGIAFLPAALDRHLFSAFVQDEISFFEDQVKLTIGSKFEHNDYTGFEIQPSARVAWIRGRQVWWGAVSRAVRTPSRFDRHLFFPANEPFIFAGGPDFDSEELIAYEVGWRVKPHERFLASVATFYNDYDDIRSTSLGPPFITQNNVEGEIYGVELEATWQATDAWRLIAGYTLLQEDLRAKPGQVDLNDGQGETFDPQQQAQVRSSLNLTRNIEFDVWIRYVDEVGSTGRGFGVVPDYVALDTRLGWSPIRSLQLALVGQNLLDEQHAEFGSREIERAVYGKATWRF